MKITHIKLKMPIRPMLAAFIRCPADIEFRASDATVSAGVPQPIMLDECMYTLQDDLNAWRFDACQRVKVKQNQVGAPVAIYDCGQGHDR